MPELVIVFWTSTPDKLSLKALSRPSSTTRNTTTKLNITQVADLIYGTNPLTRWPTTRYDYLTIVLAATTISCTFYLDRISARYQKKMNANDIEDESHDHLMPLYDRLFPVSIGLWLITFRFSAMFCECSVGNFVATLATGAYGGTMPILQRRRKEINEQVEALRMVVELEKKVG